MDQLEIRANQEHRGVALAVVVVLIVSLVLGYMLFRRVLPLVFGGTRNDYLLIAGIFSVFFTVGVLWIVDPWIKRLIPSGFYVRYFPDQKMLRYQQPETDEIEFPLDVNSGVDFAHFYFKMRQFPKSGRERQIPNSWYCLGSRLLMDDKDLILYTFLPPRKFRNLATKERFMELDFKELEEKKGRSIAARARLSTPTSNFTIPGRLLVGEKGKFWKAEQLRQQKGVELTPNDFQALQGVLGDTTPSI